MWCNLGGGSGMRNGQGSSPLNDPASQMPHGHQPLSGENLKELDEHLAIAEVGVEIGDLAVDPHQVRVHPLRERLLLHMLSLVWGTA